MGSEDSNNSPALVEYNFSGFKINHIAGLIARSDNLYMRGFLNGAFLRWKAIYGHIYNRLESIERTKCKKMEFNFYLKRDGYPLQKIRWIKNEYYERYSMFIQCLLKKYGYDIKEREEQGYLV